jgi:hypothetical protein
MSTTQAATAQPLIANAGTPIDPSTSFSVTSTKSTVSTPPPPPPPRPIDDIKKEIAATQASLDGARTEYRDAVTMASPANRSKMLLLGTMANLQEQADDAKQEADYDRILNGENPEGSGAVLNPLRLLSVDLAKKVMGALDSIKRTPKQINSLEQRLSKLNSELNATTPPAPARP